MMHCRPNRKKKLPGCGPIPLLLVPLLLLLPLTCGCLTTLVITAASQSGGDNEHVEQIKETARDVADQARDVADDLALSVHDTIESIND